MPFARYAALALSSLIAIAACSSNDGTGSDDGGVVTPPPGTPTFANDVEGILQRRCQSCHSEGGVAPFSLVTYDEAKGWGPTAKSYVTTRAMPPWGAFDDDACKVRHGFKNDLRMTDAEIATFSAWVDGGMPLGDEGARPPPATFSRIGLANKTHTLQMPAPFEVLAGGKDDIRCFSIDPGFAQDTWVNGVDVVPGDPRVVHHAIVFVDPQGESTAKAAEGGGSYRCFGGPQVSTPSLLLAWAPGVPPADYGSETAIKVNAGSKLVLQVHYHPSSQETVSDQTGFDLRIVPQRPSLVAQMLLLGNASSAEGPIKLLAGPADPPTGPAFHIPAGATAHTESMELTVPETVQGLPLPELRVHSAGAHMHWAGVDMKIEIDRKAPNAEQPAKECLLGTPKYDFNWQRSYEYDAPFDALPRVGAGDTLRFSCTYDNSMGNLHVRRALAEQQRATPADISLGEETLDEMCLGVLVLVRAATALD